MKIANYRASIGDIVMSNHEIIYIENLEAKDISYSNHHVLVWNNNYDFLISFFDKFPDIKLFINWGTATSNLPNIEEFAKREIIVKTVKGYCTKAVSEYSIKLLMDLFNRSYPIREELSYKKIGIIGMGAIGNDIASILSNGFKCEIMYYSRTKKEIPYAFTSLEEIIANCDGIIIAVDSKSFTIPFGILKNSKDGFKIVNISQDYILPANKVIDLVNNEGFPKIDIISDNFLPTDGNYLNYYTQHAAYKSRQSVINKNNLLLSFIHSYAK